MSEYFKTNGVLQQLILAAIHKMNLVTREEFEVQSKVLLKTRQKLERLEQQLAAIQVEQIDGNI